MDINKRLEIILEESEARIKAREKAVDYLYDTGGYIDFVNALKDFRDLVEKNRMNGFSTFNHIPNSKDLHLDNSERMQMLARRFGNIQSLSNS
jgi:hypothetical protein